MFPSMPKGDIVENKLSLISKLFMNDKGITGRYGSWMNSTMPEEN